MGLEKHTKTKKKNARESNVDYFFQKQANGSEAEAEAEEEDEGVSASAARYNEGNRYDACSGVVCPPLDCPTRPYIPQGECCPVCPSAPAETVRATSRSRAQTVRPDLQVRLFSLVHEDFKCCLLFKTVTRE